MNYERSSHAAVSVEDKLFVLGGMELIAETLNLCVCSLIYSDLQRRFAVVTSEGRSTIHVLYCS